MGKKKKKTVETFTFEDFENGLACKTAALMIERPFDRQQCGEDMYMISEELHPAMEQSIRQKTIGMILEKWGKDSSSLVTDRKVLSQEILAAEKCYLEYIRTQ